jgi:hypothetical protein
MISAACNDRALRQTHHLRLIVNRLCCPDASFLDCSLRSPDPTIVSDRIAFSSETKLSVFNFLCSMILCWIQRCMHVFNALDRTALHGLRGM